MENFFFRSFSDRISVEEGWLGGSQSRLLYWPWPPIDAQIRREKLLMVIFEVK